MASPSRFIRHGIFPEDRLSCATQISSKTAKEGYQMYIVKYRQIAIVLLLSALTGCTQHQDPQELKEKTAQATAEVKSDAKAMAEGIREGWSRDKPLDLNSATREQLMSLPGVTSAEAGRVIAGRPYNKPGELVSRRIMSKVEYDKIADRITAK
jgi:DNA uptake protein ComE-like DNA-binding protein